MSKKWFVSQHHFIYMKNALPSWKDSFIQQVLMKRWRCDGGSTLDSGDSVMNGHGPWPQGWKYCNNCQWQVPAMCQHWSRHLTYVTSQTNLARQRYYHFTDEQSEAEGHLSNVIRHARKTGWNSNTGWLAHQPTLPGMQHLCAFVISLPSLACYLCTSDLAIALCALRRPICQTTEEGKTEREEKNPM